ncbi:MAG: hypothetical protein AAF693_12895 [Bacteroidota bacterium]
MKKVLTLGLLLAVVLCSLAACQEELPTPENDPSEEHHPYLDEETIDPGDN